MAKINAPPSSTLLYGVRRNPILSIYDTVEEARLLLIQQKKVTGTAGVLSFPSVRAAAR